MEDQKISEFIRNIGKKIEEVSGVKLNSPQVPEEEWISEDELVMMKSEGIYLRTAEQTKNMETVKLKRFNPCIVYEDLKHGGKEHFSIPCRAPGCPETTPIKKPASCSEKTKIKQDLFLCKTHLAELMDSVSKRCAKENVAVDITSIKKDDFKGYTSLIGVLEEALKHLSPRSLSAEVFLNTRNFLIITNALLNPNWDNVAVTLGHFLTVLRTFLENPRAARISRVVLVEIKELVMGAFGVMDKWVTQMNNGGRLGGGVGLLVGFTNGVGCDRSVPARLVSSSVGLISGNLIGGAVYDLHREKRHLFSVIASATGAVIFYYCM